MCEACITEAQLYKHRKEAPDAKIDKRQPIELELEELISHITAKNNKPEGSSSAERDRNRRQADNCGELL